MAQAKLVEVQHVKTFLSKEGNAEDAILGLLADGVSGLIETALGEPVTGSSTFTETLQGNLFSTITLSRRVRKILTVSEAGGVLAATDYRVDGERTLTRLSAGTTALWARADVIVSYSTGFSSVPADLRQAALIQTAFEYRQTKDGGNRLGLQSNSPGGDGEAVSYTTHDLLPEVKRIIAGYRPLL